MKCVQKIILSWLCTYPGRFPYPGPDSDNAVWMMGNPNWASISLHLGEVSTSFCQPSSACVYAYKSSLLVWISYIKILSQYHRASTLYKQGWCSHSKLKKMYMYHSPLQVFSHNLCLLYMHYGKRDVYVSVGRWSYSHIVDIWADSTSRVLERPPIQLLAYGLFQLMHLTWRPCFFLNRAINSGHREDKHRLQHSQLEFQHLSICGNYGSVARNFLNLYKELYCQRGRHSCSGSWGEVRSSYNSTNKMSFSAKIIRLGQRTTAIMMV